MALKLLLLLLFFTGCWACFTQRARPEVDGTARAQVPAMPRISVRDGWLVDTSGRVRIFHGVNAVNKEFPWYSGDPLNQTLLRLYKDWGFNVVRVGAMWTGVQPQEGAFNESYIDILRKSVDTMKQYGVYTLLDMHQDCLTSIGIPSYDGVPPWLIEKFPPSPHPYPWPLGPNATFLYWGNCYLAQATGWKFQNIYNNVAGAWTYISTFWGKIASMFSTYTSVIGYEIINEPWAGDIYADPRLLLPGVAGKTNLQPLYNYLNKAIRQVDPVTLIFYEPVTWGMIFNGGWSGTGFDSVPGGVQFRNRSVLSYHYYCWAVTGSDSAHKYSFLKRTICDKILGPKVFQTVQNDISKIGGGSFLTEFGLCYPNDNPSSTGTLECEFVLTEAERYQQSWTYWSPEFFDSQGNINWSALRPFVRVYARAVAGIPQKTQFQLDKYRYDLVFTPDLAISEPTEIFVPKFHYPGGFQVSVSPGLSWTFDPEERVVLITPKKNIFQSGQSAEVTIEPKRQGSNTIM